MPQGAESVGKAQIRSCIYDVSHILIAATPVSHGRSSPRPHVGPWNDTWEVRVNPLSLPKVLLRVTLIVDAGRPAEAHDRILIAPPSPSPPKLPITPPPSANVWTARAFMTTGTKRSSPGSPGSGKMAPTPGGGSSSCASRPHEEAPTSRTFTYEAGARSRGTGTAAVRPAAGKTQPRSGFEAYGRYSQATPSLSRSRAGR